VSHTRRVVTGRTLGRAYGGPIMRSTVGPLPPAVYWRRRALVLGVLLLIVIALFVSCGGEDDGNQRGNGASSQAPTPVPAGSTPDEEPSFSDAQPGGGPSLPAPEDLVSQPPGANGQSDPNAQSSAGTNATGTNANVTAPAGACTDQEVSVTPVPAVTAAKRGAPVVIRLKIKNVGARPCTRDLGAGAQELYMDQGARKYWSSDTCSTDRGTNLRQMRSGAEYEYTVTWNGRQSSKCTAALPGGPAPPPGTYEIRGRLGTKVSQPVAMTIVS
jgi:hypothetical protein